MNTKAVANTRLRNDVGRAFGLRFDLLTQLPHINAQILYVGTEAPYFPHKKAAGQYLARITYSKVAFAKLYDRKTPLAAADLLNDRVVPFFDKQGVKLQCVLTDRGTEYCGNPEQPALRRSRRGNHGSACSWRNRTL